MEGFTCINGNEFGKLRCIFVYFVVAIFDLAYDLSMYFTFLNYEQHLEIFSEILIFPGKLQLAAARVSLIIPKRFPDAGSS